jgi:putative endonuclease
LTRILGDRFEDRGVSWLIERGWEILTRNYRDGPREIDVVARRGNVIAFVEIKGRRNLRHGHPLEAIGFRKRRDVERAAARWIREVRPGSVEFRFDALALISQTGEWEIIHIPNAWRLGE